MEVEVVDDTAALLHAPAGAGGCMTSGGAEDIVMAVYTARERAKAEPRRRARDAGGAPHRASGLREGGEVSRPRAPAGPARRRPARRHRRGRASRGRAHRARGRLRAQLSLRHRRSHPRLAALAAQRGISMHVDGCLGGFLLPFWERLGERVPPFDFRVAGVATMSADVHKYGYCVKGASVLVHRDEEHLKKYQRFLYADWPGGLYFSQAIAGTRAAAPIAAAWAVTRRLGEEGYLALARRVREATRRIQAGIASIPGLRVIGAPVMSVFAFTSDAADPFAIADRLEERGWCVDRQQGPDALHLMLSPRHADVADEFVADLRAAAASAGRRKSSEARYS